MEFTEQNVPIVADIIDIVTYVNQSQLVQENRLTRKYERENTTTYELNAGFKGEGVSVGASESLEISFQTEVGSRQIWTKSKKEEFSVDRPIKVAPHTVTTRKWILKRLNNIKLHFNSSYELFGQVSCTILAIIGEYYWTGSIGDLVAVSIRGGAENWTLMVIKMEILIGT